MKIFGKAFFDGKKSGFEEKRGKKGIPKLVSEKIKELCFTKNLPRKFSGSFDSPKVLRKGFQESCFTKNVPQKFSRSFGSRKVLRENFKEFCFTKNPPRNNSGHFASPKVLGEKFQGVLLLQKPSAKVIREFGLAETRLRSDLSIFALPGIARGPNATIKGRLQK